MRRILTGLLAALTGVAMLIVPGSTPAPAATATRAPATLPTPVKILTAGDSLTRGVGGSDDLGYRRELDRLLTAAGVAHQMIHRAPTTTTPTTVQDVAAAMPGWLAADQPNWLILSVGTNNAAGTPPGMTGYVESLWWMVSDALRDHPNLKIVLMLVGYSNATWSVSQPYVNEYKTRTSWDFPGRVVLGSWEPVHACITYDNVHHRDLGYDWMGRQVMRALIAAGMVPAVSMPTDPNPAQVRRPGFERPAVITC